MKVNVSYSPALGKETSRDVEFDRINEWRELPVLYTDVSARVKIIKITEEPTANKTGLAIYRVEYSTGRAYDNIGIIYRPRGGARPGSGRPAIAKSKAVSLRISEEAKAILDLQVNKNAFATTAIISYASEHKIPLTMKKVPYNMRLVGRGKEMNIAMYRLDPKDTFSSNPPGHEFDFLPKRLMKQIVEYFGEDWRSYVSIDLTYECFFRRNNSSPT